MSRNAPDLLAAKRPGPGTRVGPGPFPWATAAALLAFCLILRTPVVGIPPLVTRVRADLHLSAAEAGLLTGVPVLCFGLLTAAAGRLLARIGADRGTTLCVAGVIAGCVVRSAAGVTGLWTGTVLIGAAITIGNLVVPLLIGRDFPGRTALMTGAYGATVNIAVTASTAAAVPLAQRYGWRAAAASPGVLFSLIAVAAAITAARGRRRDASERPEPPGGRAAAGGTPATGARGWSTTQTWLLAAAFAGHTLTYYSITAWLPTALTEQLHMSASTAGAASGLFQGAGIAGSFAVAALGATGLGLPATTAIIGVAWTLMPLGMAVHPQAWALWSTSGGLAQGAFFAALFTAVIRRSRSTDETRRVSTVVQTVAYVVAAIGPTAAGWARGQHLAWTTIFAGLAVLIAASTVLTVSTMASRPDPDPQDVVAPDRLLGREPSTTDVGATGHEAPTECRG